MVQVTKRVTLRGHVDSRVDYSLGLSFARPLNRQQMCKNPEPLQQCSKLAAGQ